MQKDKIPINNQRAPSGALSSHKALTLDSSLYEKYLEESDLSEDQKQEFLETLWSIIVGFVDLGFEVHPLQQATSKSCGQDAEISKLIASNPEYVLNSKNTSNKKTKKPTDDPISSSGPRIQE